MPAQLSAAGKAAARRAFEAGRAADTSFKPTSSLESKAFEAGHRYEASLLDDAEHPNAIS